MNVGLARAVILAAMFATAAPAQGENPFRPFDQVAFETHSESLGATAEAIEAFRVQAKEESVGVAADELLRSLNADYDKAVGLAQAGAPRAALALAELLGATRDPYLRAHGRYHLGRVFLDGDDPEGASEVFASFLREDLNKSPLDAEVTYFYAHALAEVPNPESAVGALRSFLKCFPSAPEKYVASATQQLAALEQQIDSPLHEIADVMQGVERRIRQTRTGKETQDRQKAVMNKLAQIIEEMEEREQSGGAPGGLAEPQAPAGSSAAPPGRTRIGNLERASKVIDRWGELQDRDREAIESELQTKLPGRYRKMLEQYYKKLGAGNQ